MNVPYHYPTRDLQRKLGLMEHAQGVTGSHYLHNHLQLNGYNYIYIHIATCSWFSSCINAIALIGCAKVGVVCLHPMQTFEYLAQCDRQQIKTFAKIKFR